MDDHIHVYLFASAEVHKCIWKDCGFIREEPIKRAWAA